MLVNYVTINKIPGRKAFRIQMLWPCHQKYYGLCLTYQQSERGKVFCISKTAGGSVKQLCGQTLIYFASQGSQIMLNQTGGE